MSYFDSAKTAQGIRSHRGALYGLSEETWLKACLAVALSPDEIGTEALVDTVLAVIAPALLHKYAPQEFESLSKRKRVYGHG